MRLTVVGCSGSVPGPLGPASCYLVEAEQPTGQSGSGGSGGPGGPGGGVRTWRLLLDLGSGALGPLQGLLAPAGLDDLDAVLLSHLHPDHCLDVCGLVVALTHGPRGPGRRSDRLPVHGPGATQERLARAYDPEPGAGQVGPADPVADVLDVRTWQVGQVVTYGPLEVVVAPVRHPVEAYALRVTDRSTGEVLVYTGDTDTCEELRSLARGADLLLAEAGSGTDDAAVRGVHLTARRAAETAARAGAGSLLLTHLPPWVDPQQALAEAAHAWDGPVALARPGETYALPCAQPVPRRPPAS